MKELENYQFAEVCEAGRSVSGLDIEEVVDVLGGLDLPEDGEVLNHQLSRDLDWVELKKVDTRLFDLKNLQLNNCTFLFNIIFIIQSLILFTLLFSA